MTEPSAEADKYRWRLEWGSRGAREAAERGDIVIIVDTLSFSSTVIAATSVGMTVYPVGPGIDADKLAQEVGGQVARPRQIAETQGGYSLSPSTMLRGRAGERVVLASFNGSTISHMARNAPAVLIGALANASAVARYAQQLQRELDCGLTIVAAGEHWQEPRPGENTFRPALEDYLGAGAILAHVDAPLDAEAFVCRAAFLAAREHLAEFIAQKFSAQELIRQGYRDDVDFACRLDSHSVVPEMIDGAFCAVSGKNACT